MNVKETLLELCSLEWFAQKDNELCRFLTNELKAYSNNVRINPLGSVICEISKPKENHPKIVLDAHLDCVSMVVKNITKEGFLKVANYGGLNLNFLISQEVKIFGKEIVEGIIQKKCNEEEIIIDVGMNEAEVKNLINVGDKISFKHCPIDFGKDEISSRFLDDRAGVLTILLTLEKLKEIEFSCGLSVIFSSLEEVSGDGAKTASYFLNPDIAVCVDVSFAEFLGCRDSENRLGKLGKGPMIGISPTLDRNLSLKLTEISEKNKIPYQLEIMPGFTSTNADKIGSLRNGISTCLCSIPLKYMHSPVETIDLNDLEFTANLLKNFIASF